jgi:uroporphyrin-III C-methyltransferase/precorrin-2 dehydrogenase/sirohydrochlorin ferrochelatase
VSGGQRLTDADLDGVGSSSPPAPDLNARIAQLMTRRVFVNAGMIRRTLRHLGGVVRRDGVTIAISTSGDAPALAGLLREGIDAMLPADLDRWTAAAREARRDWKARGVAMADRRPLLLDALVALYPEAGLKAGATEAALESKR